MNTASVTRTESAHESADAIDDAMRAALRDALRHDSRSLVLAVSGGRDSMALMHAMARWAPDRVKAVATFDHGTGQYATDAASLVVSTGRKLGFAVVRERARIAGTTESAWRTARWEFLHRVSAAFKASVATAHTQDDQLETMVMRELRGTGTRGLAALAASSIIVRPWLQVSRSAVETWASSHDVLFAEDPTNHSRAFLRARVRHDLLPAIANIDRSFATDMIALGARAAQWRSEVDAYVASWPLRTVRAGVIEIPAKPLLNTSDAGRAVLWSACCARVGVALDARGTRTVVRFTTANRRGATVEIAGGATVTRAGDRSHDYFELRSPASAAHSAEWRWSGAADLIPPRLGEWRWRRVREGAIDDPWLVGVPVGSTVSIRPWRAGDRIFTAGARAGRRVTRYFSDAHVSVLDRTGWPVVIVDGALICVPGLCRSIAAPHRPGWPDSIWYRCERD